MVPGEAEHSEGVLPRRKIDSKGWLYVAGVWMIRWVIVDCANQELPTWAEERCWCQIELFGNEIGSLLKDVLINGQQKYS